MILRRPVPIILWAMALTVAACGQSTAERPTPEFFGVGHERCSFRKLQDEGFSGALGQSASIDFFGHINNGDTKFNTYVYYFTNPETNHGNHRLLIFDLRCNYLGSYAINERPVRILAGRILFRDTGIPGNIVEFTGNSPPGQIWIDGEISLLGK